MAESYTINGREVSKAEYEVFVESLKLPPMGQRVVPGIPEGAEPVQPPEPEVQTRTITGQKLSREKRVRIRVPAEYLTRITAGYDDQLGKLGGIIFPYTPQIAFEAKADYSELKPLHSNFPIYFYQRSAITPITISGKFTVENQQDAENYIATQQLLIALTRMRFGLDADAGAPPPVCRLEAYGDLFLKNVPVAISSFRIEYPDDVDFYENLASNTSVPTRSTIAVTCIPMYSRNEMQKFSVTETLTSDYYKNKGYI